MTISNFSLMKVAAVGGIVTVTMGLMARSKIQGNVKATPFYKEALKTARSHPAAVNILGEPIKDRAIDINDDNNFCKDNQAQYEVPLRGPKQKGMLYFWASRINDESPWHVNRIELQIDKDLNKRLVIKNQENKVV